MLLAVEDRGLSRHYESLDTKGGVSGDYTKENSGKPKALNDLTNLTRLFISLLDGSLRHEHGRIVYLLCNLSRKKENF